MKRLRRFQDCTNHNKACNGRKRCFQGRLASVIALLFCLALLSGGCWDRRELSETAIILAAGVDRTPDGEIRLTAQLARPAAFGGGTEGGGGATSLNQNLVWVVSATGETILDAQRNLALQVPRHLYWGHCILLLWGEEAARHGVRNYTNFIHRNPQPRPTMWVMATPGEAKKVLESHSEMEKSSAQSIGYLFRMGAGLSMEFKDFIHDLAAYGINPVAPRVELRRQGEPQGPGMEKMHKHEEVVITGTAVFNDDKLAGWLDESETRGLLWLRGKIRRGIVVAPFRNGKVSFAIIRSHTRIEPEYDGEKIRFLVRVVTEGNLLEQQGRYDLNEPGVTGELEENIKREIEKKIEEALVKGQGEYGVDIFGFGEAFHRKYKKEWKAIKHNWNEEFKNAEISLEVEAHLRNTGLQIRRPSIKRE